MMNGLEIGVDAAQTAVLIALTGAIAFAVWRGDIRFDRLHRDIQEAIISQYSILNQLSSQRTLLDQHQALIDELRRDLEERCAKMDQRVVTLERPAKSA
jgi:hypothetical protein